MNAVDTNVLFYAHDPRSPEKQQIASELIASTLDGALVWQVACEYLWASRKLEALGYSFGDAAEDIRNLRAVWTTVLPAWTVLDRAANLSGRYSLSFWDRLLIATCLEAGVRRLYSEDFGGYRNVDSLEIVTRFRPDLYPGRGAVAAAAAGAATVRRPKGDGEGRRPES
jgi:predicted nucleic acid-binding protein